MTRARECGSKQRHATKKDAEDHKYRLARAGARPSALQFYKCKFCSGWHVGHKKRRRR